MLWPAFVGPSYTAIASSFALDQTVNLYPETRQGRGVKQQFLIGTPGLVLETTLATLGDRGWFTQDGQTWVVYGNTLYERTAPATFVSRGTVGTDGYPVSFASNGQGGDQLAIVSASGLYILDLATDTLSGPIVLPFAGPVMVVFIDGYFIINQADSPIQWFSALEDGTTWDALDFFTRSNTSDNTVGLAVTRDRVWVLGSKTSTQYYDSGDVDTPFLPYTGTTVQIGLVSPWLLTLHNDALRFIGESASGQRHAIEATAGGTQNISTPAIDLFLNSATSMDDARALSYEQEGHIFVAFTVPTATYNGAIKTPAYDVTESAIQQQPVWHFRAGFDSVTGQYTRWRAASATATDGTVLVGDYQTGAVYTLDLDAYDDNGAILKAERTAPYAGAENQWWFIKQVELGMQPGAGLSSGQGSAPVADLELSRDGGHTFVSAGSATLGALGDYVARAIWRRLGRVRADRLVMRITQTDPTKRAWGPGLWLDVEQGSGQL